MLVKERENGATDGTATLTAKRSLQWHVADVPKASNHIGLLVRDVQANSKATGAGGVEEVL
jgi:hypothetical protein